MAASEVVATSMTEVDPEDAPDFNAISASSRLLLDLVLADEGLFGLSRSDVFRFLCIGFVCVEVVLVSNEDTNPSDSTDLVTAP